MQFDRGILIHLIDHIRIQSGLPFPQRKIIRFHSSIRRTNPSHEELEKLYGEQNRLASDAKVHEIRGGTLLVAGQLDGSRPAGWSTILRYTEKSSSM